MIEIQKTDDGTRVRLELTLTREDFDALVRMVFRSGVLNLAYNFLDIANRLNEGNPDWKPYEIPEDAKPV